MEPEEIMRNKEKETWEIIAAEILDELKKTNSIISDQVTAINQLTNKVNDFNQKLDNLKITSPPVSTKAIEEIVKKELITMRLMIGSKPHSIIRKFQILLFPEQDAKLFYKIVFGRWFMWLAVMLFITLLYKWLIHYR